MCRVRIGSFHIAARQKINSEYSDPKKKKRLDAKRGVIRVLIKTDTTVFRCLTYLLAITFGIPFLGDSCDEASCNLAFGFTDGPSYGKSR